jgi:MFS transporter, DHA2 family, multidrug resistance protein
MDLTVLNLAVPQLNADLRPSGAQLLWIVDIYGFVLAGMLIPMGTLGDRIGRRRLLLMGAAAFGAASVVAALSRSAAMLIAARAVLGIAGATLAPSTLSLIRNMFADTHQRSLAIGVWITSYSVGGAIGPLLGGILLDHFWWGSVFLIGVPVMLLLLVIGPVLLPEFRDPNARRMDLVSATQSLMAVLLVIYGLKQIAQGNASWWPALAIAGGGSVGALFVRRQRRLTDPLIDLGLFRVRAFSVALGSYTLATFALFGVLLFISQYLQLVRGLTPLQAGVRMLPIFAGFIVGSMFTPMLARRVGSKALLQGGLVLAAFGFALLAAVQVNSGLALLLTAFVAYSLGLAPVFTLATDMIVGAAPPERAGAASALSETGSELGGALGIAVLGSIGTAVYRGGMARAASNGISHDASDVVRGTIGGAIAVARRLPATASAQLVGAAREAFTRSLNVISAVTAIVAVVTAIAVVVALRSMPRSAAGDSVQDHQAV